MRDLNPKYKGVHKSGWVRFKGIFHWWVKKNLTQTNLNQGLSKLK